jgi:serine protease inhibitor
MTNFLHDSNQFFGAKVKGINFKLGNNRTDNIGKWIKDNTKSCLLKSKLTLDSFKVDTNIVMFNSVYFTAQWIPDFQNSLLIRCDFYALGSRLISTQFIRKAVTLNTKSSQLFSSLVLEIPFHSDRNNSRFVLMIAVIASNQLRV